MAEGMTLEEQGEVGRAFLVGLLGEYRRGARPSRARLLDDETVEIAATGTTSGFSSDPEARPSTRSRT